MKIHEFRNKVNSDQGKIIPYLKQKNANSDYWGMLCSSMDWIESSLSYLKYGINQQLQDDIYMYYFYSKITCYDNIIESTKQLSTIIGKPFSFLQGRKVSFLGNEISFEFYIKEIRAIFGAHPTNLRLGSQKIGCVASWPTKNSDGSMFIILYRFDREKDIHFRFSLEEFEFILDEIDSYLDSCWVELERAIL